MRLSCSLTFLLVVVSLHDHKVHQVPVLGYHAAETGVKEL